MEIKCPDCGKFYADNHTNCPHCHPNQENNQSKQPNKNQLKQCLSCAMMIPQKAHVCPYCQKGQPTAIKVWRFIIVFVIIIVTYSFIHHQLSSNKPPINSTSQPISESEKQADNPRQAISDKDDILPKYSMVWKTSIHIMHYVDLLSEKNNVATNYFNSLVNKKLAYHTNDDLPVMIIDAMEYKDLSIIRVTVKNGNGEGWVFRNTIKFSQNK
jgi:RNA polymerase subunit RPABC4/transcription elongation factor Spt4